jgi:DNA (cytosine-5)-methyltransferase 1
VGELGRKLTVGSLFAGIGGFDLGLERAGMEVRWQVEIDPFCRAVLAKHWPEVKRYEDVRTVHAEAAHYLCAYCDDCVEPVDVLVGGDPCQRNSNAWRHGDGDDSTADHFVRLVGELRPRIVVRENPTTVRADAPWPWFRFRDELEQRGYAVLPFRLRACCVGADHTRDRLFLLATLPDANGARLEGAISQVMARADEGRHDADAGGSDRWSATPRVCRGADGISHRMDRIKSLGNAIIPQIAEWIGRRIIEAEADMRHG